MDHGEAYGYTIARSRRCARCSDAADRWTPDPLPRQSLPGKLK